MRVKILRALLYLLALLPYEVKQGLGTHKLFAPLYQQVFHTLGYGIGGVPFQILAGPAKGMQITLDPTECRAYLLGVYEPQVVGCLQDLCQPGMVVCDIGAHLGFFTLLLARFVGSAGEVHSFEPLPKNFDLLRQTVQVNGLSNVRLNQSAVSEQSGPVTFAQHANSSQGRILDSGDAGDEVAMPLNVVATCLDDYVDAKGLSNIHLIKIDVEGGEWNVLRGMRRVLAEMKPVLICEVHAPPHGNPQQVLESLFEFGYRIFDLDRSNCVLTDPRGYLAGHILALPGSYLTKTQPEQGLKLSKDNDCDSHWH